MAGILLTIMSLDGHNDLASDSVVSRRSCFHLGVLRRGEGDGPMNDQCCLASDRCKCGHARWMHGTYIPDHCKMTACWCSWFREEEKEEAW